MPREKLNGPPMRTTILVVEDDDAVRRSLQLLLRSHGFEVKAYASPGYALADHQNRNAACLIAGLMMPDLDGLTLLTNLRAEGWEGSAILIGGDIAAVHRAQAAEMEFSAILDKPISDFKLMDALRGLAAGT